MTLKLLCNLLLAVAVAVSTATAAAPPIKIDSRYVMAPGPATFRIRITLEPDARNRYVCLQWVQLRPGHAEHTSCWEVDAEHEAKTTWKDIKEIPAGKYGVTAYVVRNDEQATLSNRLTLIVTGFGFEMDPEQ